MVAHHVVGRADGIYKKTVDFIGELKRPFLVYSPDRFQKINGSCDSALTKVSNRIRVKSPLLYSRTDQQLLALM